MAGTGTGGLPRQLLVTLGAGFARQLMGEANDLVVNTDSMTAIDRSTGAFIKDQFDFGTNGLVYHTVYFYQPQVVNSLTRWLQLAPPDAPAGAAVPIAAGTITVPEVPAAADIDVVIAAASEPHGAVCARIAARQPSYLVVKRPHPGGVLHYAFPAEEALEKLQDPELPLEQALNLHEHDASPSAQLGAKLPPPGVGPRPTTLRRVLLHGATPVAVIPESAAITAASISRAFAPLRTGTAQLGMDAAIRGILQRRIMPSYTRAMPTMALRKMSAPPPPVYAAAAAKSAASPSARAALPAQAPAAPPPVLTAAPATPTTLPPLIIGKHRKAKTTATPAASQAGVPCHFHAAMPNEVEVAKVADVQVTVSREQLQFVTSAVSGGKTVTVQEQKKITIQILAKANARNEGEDRIDIDVPAPGAPVELHFEIVPTQVGDGVIHVLARQGPLPIVTIELRPQFVNRKANPSHATDGSATAAPADSFDGPVDQLRIDERVNGTEVFYQFEFFSERLSIIDRFESPPLKGGREAFVNALYKKIEDRGLSTGGDLTAFQQELRAVGGEMWSELFPSELQQLLWDNRSTLHSVMILSSEPFIPWELVHFKEPGRPQLPKTTLFLGQCGAVRWLIGAPWPPKQLRVRPGRSFTLVPRYPHPDYELTESIQEETAVAGLFGAVPHPAEQNAVRDLLTGPAAFDLLHFAGHGRAETNNVTEAQILLTGRVEDQNYVEETLNATTVAGFADFKDSGGNRPVVTLNACQVGLSGYKLTGMGGFAPAFLGAGAGLFIGTLWSVGDQPARIVVVEFYKSLLRGRTVAEAVIEARDEAKLVDATWLAYVFYGHPHARLRRS